MVRLYATAADLTAYDDTVTIPDAKAERLLRLASLTVDRLLTGRCYDTDTDGMPTVADDISALRDATCAIVLEANAANVLTPGAAGEWTQIGIGNVSLSGKKVAEGTLVVNGIPVPAEAVTLLASVGTLQVWVR